DGTPLSLHDALPISPPHGGTVAPLAFASEEVGIAVEIARIDPRRIFDDHALDRELVLSPAQPLFGRQRRRSCGRTAARGRRVVRIAERNLTPGRAVRDLPFAALPDELVDVAASEQRRRPVVERSGPEQVL